MGHKKSGRRARPPVTVTPTDETIALDSLATPEATPAVAVNPLLTSRPAPPLLQGKNSKRTRPMFTHRRLARSR